MGEIIDLHQQNSLQDAPQRALENSSPPSNSRRKAYVLRQFSKPGTYIQVTRSLLGDVQSPFEQALRLQDQNDPRAIAWYRKAIQAGEGVADSWCNLGILESGAGWKSRAMHCFQQAIRVEPRHFDAHYSLANLYYDNGELDLARIHYGIAAEISPDHPPLLHQQAMLALLDQQYATAISLLRRYTLLAEDPHSRDRAARLIQRIRADVAMDGT
ncbi:MAG: tetratricopeptide repeat protein [Bacteroidetes bacterium]|nr:tetratricopeptide repeat protein [Bacteroidota bacterium]